MKNYKAMKKQSAKKQGHAEKHNNKTYFKENILFERSLFLTQQTKIRVLERFRTIW